MAKLTTCKTCGAQIAKNAKVCPKCGAKLKHTGFGFFLIIFGVFLFVASAGGALSSSGRDTERSEVSLELITAQEYESIQMGMTYEQVCEIIGGDGEILSESEVLGIRTFIAVWRGATVGSNANVTFQDNVVIAKSQIGIS